MFVAPIVDLGAEIKMAALQFLCYGLPLSLITVFSEHASNKSYRHGGTSAMNTHSHIHTVHTVYIYTAVVSTYVYSIQHIALPYIRVS